MIWKELKCGLARVHFVLFIGLYAYSAVPDTINLDTTTATNVDVTPNEFLNTSIWSFATREAYEGTAYEQNAIVTRNPDVTAEVSIPAQTTNYILEVYSSRGETQDYSLQISLDGADTLLNYNYTGDRKLLFSKVVSGNARTIGFTAKSNTWLYLDFIVMAEIIAPELSYISLESGPVDSAFNAVIGAVSVENGVAGVNWSLEPSNGPFSIESDGTLHFETPNGQDGDYSVQIVGTVHGKSDTVEVSLSVRDGVTTNLQHKLNQLQGMKTLVYGHLGNLVYQQESEKPLDLYKVSNNWEQGIYLIYTKDLKTNRVITNSIFIP